MTTTAEHALKTAIDNIHGDMATGQNRRHNRDHNKKPRIQTHQQPNRTFSWQIPNPCGHHQFPTLLRFHSPKCKQEKFIAIEPFVTLPDAIGRVDDSPQTTIYRLVKTKINKKPTRKTTLKYIEANFRTLAFR